MVPSTVAASAVLPDRLAHALVVGAAGSVALLLLAGAAVWLLARRGSAAVRHAIWVLGFAATLLLPVLSAVLPAWRALPGPQSPSGRVEDAGAVPIPPVPLLTSREPARSPVTGARLTTGDAVGTDATERVPATAGPPEPVAATTTTARPGNPVKLATSDPSTVHPPMPSPMVTDPGPFPGQRWVAWALACWVAGAALVFGRVLLGHLSLGSLRRRCRAVADDQLADLLRRLAAELGIRRPVELLTTPTAAMPMTWGLWRARLLLPEAAAGWPPGQLRDVLLHELAHVRRRDGLAQLVGHLGCAAYWFNPLAWVAARRMAVERERACDDLVLGGGADAPSYARHLLWVVSATGPSLPAGPAVAMARPSTLEERMRAILDTRVDRRPLTARRGAAASLLLVAALAPVAALRAQPAPGRGDPPPAVSVDGGGSAPDRGAPGEGSARDPLERRPNTRPTTHPGARSATRPAGDPFASRPEFPGPRRMGFGGPAVPAPGDGPTCTFDATVYDVRLPADKIGRLDVEALATAAATPEAFEQALAGVGAAKPLYRASQSVRLAGDTITIGTEQPFVTSSRLTDKGQTINTVQYQSTGTIFGVAGRSAAAGAVDLDLSIELSAVTESPAALTDKVKAQVVRKAALTRKGPVRPGRPFVVLSVDGGSVDADGRAVAYVARVTLGEPQPPAPK